MANRQAGKCYESIHAAGKRDSVTSAAYLLWPKNTHLKTPMNTNIEERVYFLKFKLQGRLGGSVERWTLAQVGSCGS